MKWSALVLVLVGTGAHAREDRVSASVGAEGVVSTGAGQGDVDVLLGNRTRWGLADETIFVSDARLSLDPDGEAILQRVRLRSLGVTLNKGQTRLLLGRHLVEGGGPRLVDGGQALIRLTPTVETGLWAGLAPDLFTTLPRLRPGGGPILMWRTPSKQASLVGEALMASDGLDRAGLLAQGRYATEPGLEILGRVDVQATENSAGLADAALFAFHQLSDVVRLDVFYDAYTSWRYLETLDLDPDLRRFQDRIQTLDLSGGIEDETVDTSLYQLAGVGVRIRPDLGMWTTAKVRARTHSDPDARFLNVMPVVGWSGLKDGQMDVSVAANATARNSGLTANAGPNVTWEPWADVPIAFDASGQALISDVGLGVYGDLFVDWLHRGQGLDWSLTAGTFAETLDDEGFLDTAFGGFILLTGRKNRQERDSAELTEQ